MLKESTIAYNDFRRVSIRRVKVNSWSLNWNTY